MVNNIYMAYILQVFVKINKLETTLQVTWRQAHIPLQDMHTIFHISRSTNLTPEFQ